MGARQTLKGVPRAVLPSALSVFAQCALIISRSSLEDKTFLGSIFRQATVESVT